MIQGTEINGWQAVAVFVGAVISALAAWWRLREGSVRMSNRREQPLRKLLEKKQSLQKMRPLLLQMSVQQAYGRSLDERDFVFIQTRHNPMPLLKKRLSAGDFVRLRSAGDGYEDARKNKHWRKLSFSSLSLLLSITGGLLMPPSMYFVLLGWAKGGPIAGVLFALETVTVFLLFISISGKAQAASEVLKFEECHPALGSAWKPKRSSKPKDLQPTPPSTAP